MAIGRLEEVPLREHPVFKQIRNKRHRRRTIKKFKRHGITCFLRPAIKFQNLD